MFPSLPIQLHSSEATYTLSIRAHRYWNSRHEVADGTCCDKTGRSNCDPWWCGHCQCDNRFKFCLRRHGTNRDGNEQNCPLGSYSTGEIGDDSFSFSSPEIDDDVPNPMIFNGDIWQVSSTPQIKNLTYTCRKYYKRSQLYIYAEILHYPCMV